MVLSNLLQYQELNHFYEKFHCKPNANTNPLMGFEFVFGAIFLVAATFFYSPSLHAYKTGLDKKWNCNVCECIEYSKTPKKENVLRRSQFPTI